MKKLAYQGTKGKLEDVKVVYSHPKALAQCTAFFKAHPWIEPAVDFDTAGAAQKIAQQESPEAAAIASTHTAELYGLKVLMEHLEDNPRNTTRFVFVEKTRNALLKAGKCSLLFTLKHEPGTLADVLRIFSTYGMNLFFVDILFSHAVDLEEALQKTAQKTETLSVLGTYEPYRCQ